jgi:hypothetical protein
MSVPAQILLQMIKHGNDSIAFGYAARLIAGQYTKKA